MHRYASLLALASIVACAATPGRGAPPAIDERPVVVDSARALLIRIQDAMNRRDTAAVLAAYPNTEHIVSVVSGDLRTSRAAMKNELAAQFRTLDAIEFQFAEPIVAPLGPAAAAVTAEYTVRAQRSGVELVQEHGVWSGVVAERAGRFVVIQEHQSFKAGICARSS